MMDDIDREAADFNARVEEREEHGFIPDLRRLKKSEYFYKSFWRDPVFADLYIGNVFRVYQRLIETHMAPGKRLIDIGCGPGYYSLEFARLGYQVTGIDIAQSALRVAEKTRDQNTYVETFGSLEYRCEQLLDVEGQYDIVFVSGALHHMSQLDEVMSKLRDILVPGGLLLIGEPTHDQWTQKSAAQVALIRSILALTGHWHDVEERPKEFTVKSFGELAQQIQHEYVEEHDINEGPQSHNDNESSGAEIFSAVRRKFDVIEECPQFSFIYRTLGGIRGEDSLVHDLARLLTVYDQFATESQLMEPNGHIVAARRH